MDDILIVDDSIFNLTMLSRILNPYYNITTAQNGESCIEQVHKSSPSLILLDVIMEGINGFEVLEKLKANYLTTDIPIIIITGISDENSEEYALQLGAVDFISKPFNPSVVIARIKTHIELYKYRKNAERMAMLDEMTAIPNRRSFDIKLHALWQKCIKEKLLFSVAIADIDFFKGYNDNYGHISGDNVIRTTALVLKQTIAFENGFVFRVGGEEFAILLIGFSSEKSREIVERARTNLESISLPYLTSAVAKIVTISIGGATTLPDKNTSIKSIVESADLMLYEAKKNGRNNVLWRD